MRRTVLSTFLFVAILGLGCMGVAVPGNAEEHCEDPNDPQYDPSECDQQHSNSSDKPVVSLEEAKKITGSSEAPSFTPPPRTVDSLLADLNAVAAGNKNVLVNFRARADLKPDSGNVARDLGYRAEAARLLGRHVQALDDARRVLDLSTKTPLRRVAYHTLALAHQDLGNYDKALEFMKKRRSTAQYPGQVISDNALVGMLRARNGDFEGADKDLSTAQNRSSEMSFWDNQTYVPMIKATVNTAAAEIAFLRGNYEKAERILHRAISDMDEQISAGRNNNITTPKGRTFEEVRYVIRTHDSLNLALTVLRQGRSVEAEIMARDTLRIQASKFGRYSGQVLDGLRALSEIITEQGRFEDAVKLIRASIEIYDRIGAKKDSITLGITRRTLGDTYVGQGRWQDAQKVYDALSLDLAKRPIGIARIFNANLNWAISLIRLNRGLEAIGRLQNTHATLVKHLGLDNYDSAEALGMLASALGSTGQARQALEAFIVAVPVLLSRNNVSEGEGKSTSGRLMRLRFILESYIEALQDVAASGGDLPNGINSIEEAFRIANIARGGIVKVALASSAARAASGDPELAKLARQEQNTIRKIGALTGVLRNSVGVDASLREALKIKIQTLQAARSALIKEITNRFPNYSELIDPKPATINEMRNILRPGEALLATYTTTERTYVWAIPKSDEVAFATVNLGHEALADAVDLLRAALDPSAETLDDIPEFEVEAAYRLFKDLLKPVEAGWKEAQNLLVVAHGPLGYLPLSVLPTQKVAIVPDKELMFDRYRNVQWLVRSHAVASLPSAASLRTLRNLPAAVPGREIFAGFGDPWFSAEQAELAIIENLQAKQAASLANNGVKTRGMRVQLRSAPGNQNVNSADLASLPRLPETASEVKSMAAALGGDQVKSVFIGREANEGRVKSMNLSGFKVLAFATHGLVPGDLNGLVQPALALSSPKVAGGRDDGLLTMTEVLALKLNADWVVLSACNTGSGDGAGAEAVSGLGRAFFYAGTRALLVSNWPVETTSAKALTTELFRLQAEDTGMARAEALRRVMVGLIEGNGLIDATTDKMIFSYAHPIFWAPFSLVGDGGGGKNLAR